MTSSATETVVYTDGACKGNPGPGGWAWITTDGRSDSGGEAQSTNQRMEVRAVLEALRAIDGPVHIRSDSTYVVKCFNDRWFEGWLARGWRNSQKKPVANKDLWEPLIELYQARADELRFTWVQGHSGDPMNDRADELAVAAAAVAAGDVAEAARTAVTAGAEAAWPGERAIWVVGTTTPNEEQLAELERAINRLDPESDVVVSGLRRGTELVAAERARRRGVPLAVVLPFADPAASWPDRDRDRFDSCRRYAVAEVVLDGDPASPATAVEIRNSWIAETVVGAIVVGAPHLVEAVDATIEIP